MPNKDNSEPSPQRQRLNVGKGVEEGRLFPPPTPQSAMGATKPASGPNFKNLYCLLRSFFLLFLRLAVLIRSPRPQQLISCISRSPQDGQPGKPEVPDSARIHLLGRVWDSRVVGLFHEDGFPWVSPSQEIGPLEVGDVHSVLQGGKEGDPGRKLFEVPTFIRSAQGHGVGEPDLVVPRDIKFPIKVFY